MTKEEIWKFIPTILGVVAVIGGFLYWHFKTVNGFKDDIHRLELKFKDLEQSDKLQQKSIDQLSELHDWFKALVNINQQK